MHPRRRPRRLRPGRAVFGAALAATILAACGSSQAPPADPATAVPAGAALYIGATVHPGGSLGADSLGFASAASGSAQPYAGLEATIDRLAGPNVEFTRDIQPWLGPRVGAFFTSFAGGLSLSATSRSAGAAVIDVSHQGAAKSFLAHLAGTAAHTVSYRGDSYQVTPQGVAVGFVGSFVVIGAPAAFRATVDTHDGAAAMSAVPTFQEAHPGVPADPIAEAHIGAKAFEAAVPAETPLSGALGVARAVLSSSSLSAVDASLAVPASNTAVLAMTLNSAASGPAAALTAAQVFDSLPGDSWLALGTGTLGAAAERLLAAVPSASALSGSTLGGVIGLLRTLDGAPAQHLLRWAGPTGVFGAGAGLLDLSAGVVITTRDDAAAKAAVMPLADRLASSTGAKPTTTSVVGADAAARVPLPGLPITVLVVHVPGKVIIGLGRGSVETALHPSTTLGTSAIGKAAARTLGAGVAPSLLIDVPTLVSVVDAVNQLSGSPILGTLPKIASNLGDLVAGTVTSGATQTVRVTLTLP